MNLVLDSSFYSKFNDPIRGDEHVPNITFTDGSSVSNDSNYTNFGFAVLSSNQKLNNGFSLREKMSQAKADKAQKLGLRGKAYSDFVELDILPSSITSRDNQVSSLTSPVDDMQFTMPNTPSNAQSIIGAIKETANSGNEILSQTLSALNHQVTILQNSNEIQRDLNQISLERNRLLEVQNHSTNALNKVLVESLTSISQSLEFLPSLIETIAIGHDKIVDTSNIANSHLFQKNVNDAYSFNYDKNDPNGSKKSISSMEKHLKSLSVAHSTISKHQEKQAKHAENEIKNFDDENSPAFLSLLSDVFDYLSGGELLDDVGNVISDVDIFTYLMNETTIKKEDLKNV